MTLRAKARKAGESVGRKYGVINTASIAIANSASDQWEPILQSFLATPEARYHGRPFYGAQYGCPACAMGRDCSFANAIRMVREEYAE